MGSIKTLFFLLIQHVAINKPLLLYPLSHIQPLLLRIQRHAVDAQVLAARPVGALLRMPNRTPPQPGNLSGELAGRAEILVDQLALAPKGKAADAARLAKEPVRALGVVGEIGKRVGRGQEEEVGGAVGGAEVQVAHLVAQGAVAAVHFREGLAGLGVGRVGRNVGWEPKNEDVASGAAYARAEKGRSWHCLLACHGCFGATSGGRGALVLF